MRQNEKKFSDWRVAYFLKYRYLLNIECETFFLEGGGAVPLNLQTVTK